MLDDNRTEDDPLRLERALVTNWGSIDSDLIGFLRRVISDAGDKYDGPCRIQAAKVLAQMRGQTLAAIRDIASRTDGLETQPDTEDGRDLLRSMKLF